MCEVYNHDPRMIGGMVPCRKCGAMNPVGMICNHFGIFDSKTVNKDGLVDMKKLKMKDFDLMAGPEIKLGVPATRGKYHREIQPGVWVDVYDVIEAFGVTDGGLQHALKKILAVGQRGHKDEAEDRKDIALSVRRSNEIFERRKK